MNKKINFGDNVKVLNTKITRKYKIANLIANVYGHTKPSMIEVDVIGKVKDDFAYNIFIEEKDKDYWISSDLIEFIDHAPDTEIMIGDTKLIRDESGEWIKQNNTVFKDNIKRFVNFFKRK